jgi:hypothetical protein
MGDEGIHIFEKDKNNGFFLEAHYLPQFFEFIEGHDYVIVKPNRLLKALRTYKDGEMILLASSEDEYELIGIYGKTISILRIDEDNCARVQPMFENIPKNKDGIPIFSDAGSVKVEAVACDVHKKIIRDSDLMEVNHHTIYLNRLRSFGVAYSREGYAARTPLSINIDNSPKNDVIVRLPSVFRRILKTLSGTVQFYLDEGKPVFLVEKTSNYSVSYAIMSMELDEIERIKIMIIGRG